MKFQDVDIFGTLRITGSFQVPHGYGTGSYPENPTSGSLFLDTSDEKLYVYEGQWEVVGVQTEPVIPPYDIEYLVVAGGGGGGGVGGAGGAGGYLTNTITSVADTEYTITIGGGGGTGLSTDDISEGSTNLYHTTARARAAFSGGDGINISAAGLISFDGEGELNSYQGNDFINTGSVGTGIKAYMTGSQAAGTPIGRLSALYAGTTYNVLNWTPGGVDVQGFITATGDVEVKNGVFRVGTQSSLKASIDQSGNGFFTGTVTAFGSASDERLKENIVPLTSCLEKTLQLNGVMFNYKDRPEDTIPGVIAQEVEKVLPEAVYNIEIEDETYKAVRYQQLVPLLIEAIKELTEKVNTLENSLNNDG